MVPAIDVRGKRRSDTPVTAICAFPARKSERRNRCVEVVISDGRGITGPRIARYVAPVR
jgi:hypothetical protein